jgi:hypothetical protein
MKLRNFRVDEDRWQRFKSACQARGTNASAELLRFVELYLAGYEFPDSPEEVAPKRVIEDLRSRLEVLEGKWIA